MRTRNANLTGLEWCQQELSVWWKWANRGSRGERVSPGPSHTVRAPSPGHIRMQGLIRHVNPFTIKSRGFLECGTQTPVVSPSTSPS